jgi:cytochrome c oxidase cbb3-type subunit 3
MKNKFLLITILTAGAALPVMAEDAERELSSGELMNYIGYGAIVFSLLLFIVVMLIVLRAFKTIARALLGPDALKKQVEEKAVAEKPKNSTVNRLLSLRPLSEEKELIMEHQFDGIHELDNPTPAWFMGLFLLNHCVRGLLPVNLSCIWYWPAAGCGI